MAHNVVLTDLELKVVHAMIAEGCDCNGASSVEELQSDNMTWMSVDDIVKVLKITRQGAGAVLGSLESKGVAFNSGESARGARNPDWYLAEWAIAAYWPN